MSYVYDVDYRVAGSSSAWTLGVSGVTTADPGGRATVTGLVNGTEYEFEIRRTAPTARTSDRGLGTPLAGIEVPPDTFDPSGDPAVSDDGSTTAQRGSYNGQDGGLLRFTGGANWEYFEAYVGGTLLCRVEKSPKKYFISGAEIAYESQSVVVEITSNRAYFIDTDGAADLTVKPNGGSAITLNIV